MACFHPLRAYAKEGPDGKKILKFLNSSIPPGEGKKRIYDLEYGELLELPCGQCIGCRMDYAHEWTNRLLLEKELYSDSECHFVTLTYSEDWISKRLLPAHDNDTGEVVPNLWSLSKRELQLFMKRLRKALPNDKIRFYACGEYGGKNGRAHYHLILFGCHLPCDDLQPLGRSQIGNDYYSSKLLNLCWPFGFNVVARVTPESIGYTARYMLKKQKGDDSFVYTNYNLVAPFSLCSRKPGIGFRYYESHPEIFDHGLSRITVATDKGIKQFYPPKYFLRLLEQERPEIAKDYKLLRQDSIFEKTKAELMDTDMNFVEYLAVKEADALRKGKTIESFRNLI